MASSNVMNARPSKAAPMSSSGTVRCPGCNYVVPSSEERCPGCGIALGEDAPDSLAVLGRPVLDSFVAIVNFLIGLPLLVMAPMAAVLVVRSGAMQPWMFLVIGAVFAVGVALVLSAFGIWSLHPWGRGIQMVWASLGLLNFPFGTGVSILVLYYYTRPGIQLLYSGRPLEELDDDERWLIQGAVRSPLGTVILCLYLLPFLVMAAIFGLAVSYIRVNFS